MTGRAADVRERSGVGASAKPPPRLPRAPGGLWARGSGLRQVRAGVHGPGRPPEEGSLRARVRGPAELLRRRGQEDPEGRLLGRTSAAVRPRAAPGHRDRHVVLMAPRRKRLETLKALRAKRT